MSFSLILSTTRAVSAVQLTIGAIGTKFSESLHTQLTLLYDDELTAHYFDIESCHAGNINSNFEQVQVQIQHELALALSHSAFFGKNLHFAEKCTHFGN